jgi:hypothetical protein
MFDEPQVVKAHLVGEYALLQGLLDQHVVVDIKACVRPLHLVEQPKFILVLVLSIVDFVRLSVGRNRV